MGGIGNTLSKKQQYFRVAQERYRWSLFSTFIWSLEASQLYSKSMKSKKHFIILKTSTCIQTIHLYLNKWSVIFCDMNNLMHLIHWIPYTLIPNITLYVMYINPNCFVALIKHVYKTSELFMMRKCRCCCCYHDTD